jgi:hypothetical protein
MSDQRLREEIKKFLESNENENTAYHNLWDTANTMLRGKFIATSTYINKAETSQINNLMVHLKLLEKQEQTCTPMFITALFTIAKLWKQPKCRTTDAWINICNVVLLSHKE